jgi:drug/metabolite transporter (DMT)-like permease
MLSGFFNGATGILYYQSLQTIPTAFAVILLFQFTWMGMLVDWIIQRRAPGRNQWIAVVIVLTGTFSSAGLDTSVLAHINPLGILLGLLAAASYTGFINVNGRVGLDVPPAQKSAWMMTGATLLTLIVFPPHFLFDGSITHGLWIWAALLGIFGVIIPPYLYARGIPFVGTSMATILGSIELPVVVILSSLVLREPVSWTQWLGTILILAGIVVSEYRRLLPVKQNTQQPSATSTNPLNSANDCTSPSQHQGPALHQ